MSFIFQKVNLSTDIDKWNQIISEYKGNQYLSYNPSLSNFFIKYYKLVPSYFFVYEESNIVALIPGVISKGKIISLPIFAISGFLILKDLNVKKLYEDFKIFLNISFEIRTKYNFSEFIYNKKVLCFLKLKENVNDQLAFYKSKHRSQILKGYKNGLVCEVGGKEFVNDFYNIYKHSLHLLGTPVPSIKYFYAFFDEYEYGDIKISLIKNNNLVIGAGIYMSYFQFSEIVYAATIRSFNKLNTNLVLYWEMIKYSINSGKIIFSMGRSDIGSSGESYKDNWKCEKEIVCYNYSSYNLIRQDNLFLRNMWKRIPFNFANILGPLIRKKIMS